MTLERRPFSVMASHKSSDEELGAAEEGSRSSSKERVRALEAEEGERSKRDLG